MPQPDPVPDTSRDSDAEPGPAAGPAAGPATAQPTGWRGWLKRWSGVITGVVLLLLGAVAVRHVAEDFDYNEVWAYLHGLPMGKVLQALALTAAGYLVLTLYDVSALYYLRLRMPYSTVALGSFAGYAVSNNVGFAVISGGSVRYRVYSAAGLTAADIAKIVVFSTTTFTLGLIFTGGLGIIVGPHPGAQLLNLPEWVLQAAGGLTLFGLFAATVLTAVTHRPVKLGPWSFSLPSGGLVLSQIAIASFEIVLSGAALFVLLPEGHGASFMEFIGIFCAALAIAITSHVPGGIGVFEAVLLLGLKQQGSAGGVLGALLAFRFIYYVVPLVAAGVALGGWELRMQSGSIAKAWRETMRILSGRD
ncbi:MAG TPA: lysylphosphatidylglycerol synthase domain-containing protein [Azospirillaceae bacterium]|nr:lysylphosphatidylglycerol synthase domain-containing protein [Azospirillaceae bacterium]